jgi:hypothetical protein
LFEIKLVIQGVSLWYLGTSLKDINKDLKKSKDIPYSWIRGLYIKMKMLPKLINNNVTPKNS